MTRPLNVFFTAIIFALVTLTGVDAVAVETAETPDTVVTSAPLMMGQNSPEDIVRQCQAMIDSGEATAEHYVALILIRVSTHDIKGAFELIDDGLRQLPDDEILSSVRIGLDLDFGRFDDALATAERMLKINPDASEAKQWKGIALLHKGQYAAAAEILRGLCENDLCDSMVLLACGDAFRMSGSKVEASATYMHIIETLDDKPELKYYRLKALAFAGAGRHDIAASILDYVEKALGTTDDSTRAILQALAGDADGAMQSLRSYAAKESFDIVSVLLDYHFHSLHRYPDFAMLLKENGIDTSYNPDTGVLDVVSVGVTAKSTTNPMQLLANLRLTDDADEVLRQFNSLCPYNIGAGGEILSLECDSECGVLTLNLRDTNNFLMFDELESDEVYKNRKTLLMSLMISETNNEMPDEISELRYN